MAKCIVCDKEINGSHMERLWDGEQMCMECEITELEYSVTYDHLCRY